MDDYIEHFDYIKQQCRIFQSESLEIVAELRVWFSNVKTFEEYLKGLSVSVKQLISKDALTVDGVMTLEGYIRDLQMKINDFNGYSSYYDTLGEIVDLSERIFDEHPYVKSLTTAWGNVWSSHVGDVTSKFFITRNEQNYYQLIKKLSENVSNNSSRSSIASDSEFEKQFLRLCRLMKYIETYFKPWTIYIDSHPLLEELRNSSGWLKKSLKFCQYMFSKIVPAIQNVEKGLQVLRDTKEFQLNRPIKIRGKMLLKKSIIEIEKLIGIIDRIN